jgi:hypothetical protein
MLPGTLASRRVSGKELTMSDTTQRPGPDEGQRSPFTLTDDDAEGHGFNSWSNRDLKTDITPLADEPAEVAPEEPATQAPADDDAGLSAAS